MSIPNSGAVLVTGISGLLGAEVAARLLADGYSVIGLLHHRAEIRLNNGKALLRADRPAHAGLTVRHGSLAEPDFGLPAAEYRELLAEVGAVVHSGAVTRFDLPRTTYQEINVGGTEEVLKFCQRCAADVDLVHVSTAFVVGTGTSVATERHATSFQPASTNFYEESKYQGELALHRLGFGDRAVIVRPSIIAGDERRGRIREFGNFYVAVKAATSGHVSVIPGDYAASLNLVPIDYVADCVIAALCGAQNLRGTVMHAVSRRAVTMRDFSDVFAEYPELRVPRFVSQESFAAAARAPIERRIYDTTLRNYDPYFIRRVEFASAASERLLGRVPAGGRPYLRRLIDYAVAAGYLGARQAVAS